MTHYFKLIYLPSEIIFKLITITDYSRIPIRKLNLFCHFKLTSNQKL